MRFKLILVFSALVINSTIIMAQKTIKQTAGRDQLGEFAPKFAELNDDVLLVRCGAVRISWDCATAVW